MQVDSFVISKFIIHKLNLNDLGTNCFVVQLGSDAILIDPSAQGDVIANYLVEKKLSLKLMIATHGHFDHVSAASVIIDTKLVDTLYIHEHDFTELKKARTYMMLFNGQKMKTPTCRPINNEVFEFLDLWGLSLRHVGGHSRGSCVLFDLDLNFLISGDLILHHKLNISKLNKNENLKEFKIFYDWVETTFNSQALILPGHGAVNSLENELLTNEKWDFVRNLNEFG